MMRSGYCRFMLCCLLGLPLWGQVTEAVSTVAKEAWLLETDLYSWMQDRQTGARDGVHHQERLFCATMLSRGLAETLDLHVGFDTWHRHKESGEASSRLSGLGDMHIRAKWNFYGKEGREWAFALLPWVLVPSSKKGIGARTMHLGLLLPWSKPLGTSATWHLAGMAGVATQEDESSRRRCVGLTTLTLSHCLSPAWSLFGEALLEDLGRSRVLPRMGVGAQWQQGRAQYVLACYGGLVREAPDWQLVLSLNLH